MERPSEIICLRCHAPAPYRQGKKFCSEDCRHKSQKRSNDRRDFALRLLRFMEKKFPDQIKQLKEKL